MQTVQINGESRAEFGKSANAKLRKAGQVPCVIYGGDDIIHFHSEPLAFKPLIYTPDFKLAEVSVAGKTHKCIIKDIQFHPVTDSIVHVDFLELKDGNQVKLQVPVKFEGVSPGVRGGGKLIQVLRKIKIKTTPDNIVDHLSVDISELELNESVRVRDLQIPDGIEVINNTAIPIASVEVPRALKSAEAEEAAAAAAAGEPGAEPGAEGDAGAEATTPDGGGK